jgi:hypothetical protein
VLESLLAEIFLEETMSTDVMSDLSISPTSTDVPDDPDGLAHVADEVEITRSAVEGTVVTALCGYKLQQVRDAVGLPICEECRRLNQLLL